LNDHKSRANENTHAKDLIHKKFVHFQVLALPTRIQGVRSEKRWNPFLDQVSEK
jgi:hypothetical protein